MSGSWKTSPTSRWKRKESSPAATAAMSWPRARIVPSVGPRCRRAACSRVDLPLPLAPQQHHLLARVDVQVDAVERDLPAVVEIAHAAQVK